MGHRIYTLLIEASMHVRSLKQRLYTVLHRLQQPSYVDYMHGYLVLDKQEAK